MKTFTLRSGTTFTIAQDSDDKQVTRRPNGIGLRVLIIRKTKLQTHLNGFILESI